MFSSFHGIEVGRRAVNAQRRFLDIISHNISNVNTEGYAKQRPHMTAIEPMNSTISPDQPYKGQIGVGVEVTSIESMRDRFLDEKVQNQMTRQKYYEMLDFSLSEIDKIFNEPSDANIRSSLTEFFNAWDNLSSSPDSSAFRSEVLEKARLLINDIHSTYKHLMTQAQDIDQQIKDSVTEINDIAAEIVELNKKIKYFEASIQDNANDLIDKRNLLIEKLAEKIDIDVIYHQDHEVSIRVNDRMLVLKDEAFRLTTTQDGEKYGFSDIFWDDIYPPRYSSNDDAVTVSIDASASRQNHIITVEQKATAQVLKNEAVNGGAGVIVSTPENNLASELGVTDGSFTINGKTIYIDADETTLYDLRDLINNALTSVKAEVYEISGTGYFLKLESTKTGISNQITLGHISDTSNVLGDASGPGVGLGFITGYDASGNGILDAQAETQAAQNARFQMDGTSYEYESNRINDLISGVEFVIRGAGTSFINIKPIATDGELHALLYTRDNIIKNYLQKLDDLTYSIINEVNEIHFKSFGLADDSFQNNFFKVHYSSFESLPEKGAAEKLQLEDAVNASLDNIAAADYKIVPPSLLPESRGSSNGDNAIEIARLASKKIFTQNTETMVEYFTSLISDLGTKARAAEMSLDRENQLLKDMKNLRDSKVGVSLDEEFTDLIKAQKAFEAAAKFISIVDSMYDTIINRMGVG